MFEHEKRALAQPGRRTLGKQRFSQGFKASVRPE